MIGHRYFPTRAYCSGCCAVPCARHCAIPGRTFAASRQTLGRIRSFSGFRPPGMPHPATANCQRTILTWKLPRYSPIRSGTPLIYRWMAQAQCALPLQFPERLLTGRPKLRPSELSRSCKARPPRDPRPPGTGDFDGYPLEPPHSNWLTPALRHDSGSPLQEVIDGIYGAQPSAALLRRPVISERRKAGVGSPLAFRMHAALINRTAGQNLMETLGAWIS